MWAAVRSVLAVVGFTVVATTSPASAAAAATLPPIAAAITSIQPSGDQPVGVAHPVMVTFDGPVTDRVAAEHALRVRSVPAMTGRYEWVEDSVVHWRPDAFWPAHSTVTLSVGGLTTEFTTGPAVLGVADLTAHTFTVSVDHLGVTPGPPLPAAHHLPHYGEAGVLPASMGKEKFPTPVGTYTVLAKDRSVVMDSSSVGIPIDDPEGYRLTVDHAVRISARGIYVHSAPWALRSLGVENSSHGCINLSPTDAEWYFDTANIGDPVIVIEGPAIEGPAVPDPADRGPADREPAADGPAGE
ncbi:L,D-transpeptidase [Mycolicibacillus trivialis]